MLTPCNQINNLKHQQKSLACRFSLLVWNVHKENLTHPFAKKFSALLQTHPSDILLLQEIKYPKPNRAFLQNYSFALAANMETKKHLYGVLTAAQCSFETLTPTLSLTKELGFISHKSFLISEHRLCDNRVLYLVNIHAINFVSNKSFAKELQHIQKSLQTLPAPLIIGGDFNNWNKKRLQILQKFQEALGLQKLDVQEPHHIKSIFSHSIDHIYYKGLKALSATAIDTQHISDHNPIHALFELEK
ncbi:MAG TPA: endonuclease/exonuclease/phosphatase family protein [Sulfurimonas autotrophica]|uniref:Endonuclease/exonuclease/phosphatase family protein n=1 Tax=Sulfurimonas autotrophica TaxID=202747 RepID=A0A7C3G4C5_9BACT|nr:endonuclease/exonuclease/phosphatase family protein [Sulfurimonas autotrophica]